MCVCVCIYETEDIYINMRLNRSAIHLKHCNSTMPQLIKERGALANKGIYHQGLW